MRQLEALHRGATRKDSLQARDTAHRLIRPTVNFGSDYSIFANGLPDFRSGNLPVGSQSLSSQPVMDMTLALVSDERAVLIMDLYKMQFTPPEYVWWSTLPSGPNQAAQPNPVSLNLGDLLGDTYTAAGLAALASDIEILITSDPRFVAAQIDMQVRGSTLTITETVTPADGSVPIQLVLNATGSQVRVVSVS